VPRTSAHSKVSFLTASLIAFSIAAVAAETPPAEATGKEPLKVNGFFDFRFTTLTKDPSSGQSGTPESGFGLEDGALYLIYPKDKITLTLDIPFRRMKNSDQNITTNPNASPNGNVLWGADKAQAFLKIAATPTVEIILGQFDTIFGVEVNDSKERFFSKTGLIYDYILPVTHTGVMVSYTKDGAYARLLEADPNNKGSLGASTTGDSNYEYGAALGYSNEIWRVQAGYLSRSIGLPSGSGSGTRSLTDIIGGATLGRLSIDFEGALVSDSSKNTLTPTNLNDREQDGSGLLALITYNFTEVFSSGIRIEHIEADPGQVNLNRESAYALSGHYKYNSMLEFRADYTGYAYQNVGSSNNLYDTRVSVASLFVF
jgi:hypothetical protein